MGNDQTVHAGRAHGFRKRAGRGAKETGAQRTRNTARTHAHTHTHTDAHAHAMQSVHTRRYRRTRSEPGRKRTRKENGEEGGGTKNCGCANWVQNATSNANHTKQQTNVLKGNNSPGSKLVNTNAIVAAVVAVVADAATQHVTKAAAAVAAVVVVTA